MSPNAIIGWSKNEDDGLFAWHTLKEAVECAQENEDVVHISFTHPQTTDASDYKSSRFELDRVNKNSWKITVVHTFEE